MRRVTFSRNVTLSLSRTCRCHCKYCAFATHKPHLHEPDEVERLIDRAARRGVKELLVLTGEAPAVQDKLDALGFEDFVAYVVWACEKGLERGLLPHTNLGVLEPHDLARLREVTASPGPDARVDQPRPRRPPGLADQAPGDPAADASATRERAEDPVHERDPGRDRRVRGGPDGVARGARRASTTSRRSSSRTSSRTGATTARSRPRSPPRPPSATGATGLSDAPHRDAPQVVDPVTVEDMVRLVQEAKRLMPGRRHPGAAEPRRLVARAGPGRRDRPRRALEQRRPHLARAPVPVARSRCASACRASPRRASGCASTRST